MTEQIPVQNDLTKIGVYARIGELEESLTGEERVSIEPPLSTLVKQAIDDIESYVDTQEGRHYAVDLEFNGETVFAFAAKLAEYSVENFKQNYDEGTEFKILGEERSRNLRNDLAVSLTAFIMGDVFFRCLDSPPVGNYLVEQMGELPDKMSPEQRETAINRVLDHVAERLNGPEELRLLLEPGLTDYLSNRIDQHYQVNNPTGN